MTDASSRSSRPRDVAVVTPVFNDWPSFEQLLLQLDALTELDSTRIHVIAVDDGSVQARPDNQRVEAFLRIESVRIVRLLINLGHQRAIAVGLALASQDERFDSIVVMDCDGEDLPVEIPRLLALAREHPGAIVCAQRRKRSESIAFKVSYRIYKALFRLMTGAQIDFGNFSLMPRAAATALVHNPATWNHLAAAVTRARLPLVRLPTTRGHRYAGSSKMNLVSLVLHGLSAISVYSDVLMVRVILALLSISVVTAVALLATVAIRLFTDLAIPGWASFVGMSLAIILLQSLIFSFLLIFMGLSQRSVKPVIPAIDARDFVGSDEILARDGTIVEGTHETRQPGSQRAATASP